MTERKKGVNRGNAGKGRPKGSPNKTTADARAAMELAFEGIGGAKNLTQWARLNETEFYKLWGRLIPAQQQHSGAVKLSIEYVEADD